ncbi:hypothetical protein OQ257_00030 [Actinobacillus equuli subsp. equuli]|uniref:Uncharacterized protein n=1 Tax=Actinobacillus equuli subsp. equuli TaxID=202947 RepID=A0A9X4G0G0_ACTEU|nr:hypothetical protein [Actinobacillus equuli]MDE8033562.1 hypothetical protein [Actinobacillus equuli subsp. equuli]
MAAVVLLPETVVLIVRAVFWLAVTVVGDCGVCSCQDVISLVFFMASSIVLLISASASIVFAKDGREIQEKTRQVKKDSLNFLAVGSWQLAVGSWQLAVGSWQLAVGSWQYIHTLSP